MTMKCKQHDVEFDPLKGEGFPTCVAERRTAALATQVKDKLEQDLNLVKVQYFSTTTGEISPREYTYYSENRLEVGTIVEVPVKDHTIKAKVSAIDVPVSEIEEFKDKVKTIPAGSKMAFQPEPVEEEMEIPIGGLAKAAQDAGAEVTVVQATFVEETEIELAQRPGADILALSYHVDARGLLLFAEQRVIATLEDNKAASDDLTLISKIKKQMEAKKHEYIDPLREQEDAIRQTYTLLMAPILEAEKLTKDKMLAYNAEQERIRKEQEDINRKRLEAAEQEMKLTGELSESVGLVAEVLPAPKKVSTILGTSGQKDNWKWRVIDFALVPDEYKIINPAILTPTAKSYKDTRTIPGIEIYNEPGIATRAR